MLEQGSREWTVNQVEQEMWDYPSKWPSRFMLDYSDLVEQRIICWEEVNGRKDCGNSCYSQTPRAFSPENAVEALFFRPWVMWWGFGAALASAQWCPFQLISCLWWIGSREWMEVLWLGCDHKADADLPCRGEQTRDVWLLHCVRLQCFITPSG